MQFRKLANTALLSALAAFAVSACSQPPAPRRTLNVEDKTADFYWLFSQFNENYAPLEMKESLYKFSYADLKTKYLADAQATKSNDEFYALMYRFVSQFKDAHTSAALETSDLPKRAVISYLGFSGKRKGTKLLVTDFLPTVKEDTDYPIKTNDLIVKLNGEALTDIVENEMVNWRNLGSREANLTYHMSKIFNRVNTSNGVANGDTAVLTVERAGKELQVALPWIKKDLASFKEEQAAATPKKAAVSEEEEEESRASSFQLGFLGLTNDLGDLSTSPFSVGQVRNIAESFLKLMPGTPGFFWNSFRFVDSTPTWTTTGVRDPQMTAAMDDLQETFAKLAEGDPRLAWAKGLAETLKGKDAQSSAQAALERLAAVRNVPSGAIPIADAKTFPMYITREKLVDENGKETGGSKLVAYMFLDTFSPQGGDPLKELDGALATMKTLGVNDLVIDMINNGGGSLILGMSLAQKLSNEKVEQSNIQFRLSETWMDSFESDSLPLKSAAQKKTSDSKREYFKRVYESMVADQAAGKRLSRPLNVEMLSPMSVKFEPNKNLDTKLNIVVLINEMCASMCDIFTANLKDNNMATVVGTKSMGAGGNVVDHPMAPNSHLSVRQTESLILRKDGSYIENNGVDPDVAMAVNESVSEKYDAVRKAGLKVLTTVKAAEAPKPAEPAKPVEQPAEKPAAGPLALN